MTETLFPEFPESEKIHSHDALIVTHVPYAQPVLHHSSAPQNARSNSFRVGRPLSNVIEQFGFTGTLSPELVAFAKRQLVNATLYKGRQRRREGRFPMMVPVIGVALDDQNQPVSDPFEMVTRDVGATSVGLIHEDPMLHQRIAIHMVVGGVDVDMAIALKWRGALGPFYGSGGVYLARLDHFPCQMDCLYVC